jgi:hypothetical protein
MKAQTSQSGFDILSKFQSIPNIHFTPSKLVLQQFDHEDKLSLVFHSQKLLKLSPQTLPENIFIYAQRIG